MCFPAGQLSSRIYHCTPVQIWRAYGLPSFSQHKNYRHHLTKGHEKHNSLCPGIVQTKRCDQHQNQSIITHHKDCRRGNPCVAHTCNIATTLSFSNAVHYITGLAQQNCVVMSANSKLVHWFRPLGMEQVLPFNSDSSLLTGPDKNAQQVRCGSLW